ncbi:WD40 repeat-like protein [Myriangium duriaei CBS 260.36]|uniref:WD repeat-containing protein JIP5 n=1 Tax=Myriangium duriaei CBS 260.36 TaxID=1168546 RepID=A0A9P4IUL3_9PEZI|nr:WD40 repeat-like protein [Myriangium duriaei CBS 260.36]
MFDTVCTLPLETDLFCQAIHPSEPILATGLASGHVSVYRLPSLSPPDDASTSITSDTPTTTSTSDGRGQIETVWRTRRHQYSCRSLDFTLDGSGLFSTGADGLVKFASSATGQVIDKIAVPLDDDIDAPSLLHVLSPQTLLLATDSSALHLYDLRVNSKSGCDGFAKRKPQQTHHPHTDYVSSLTPLPPTEASTSGYSKQWVSTGGTTLAVTDLRRGVLVQSEDQEDVLLSSVAVSGLSAKGTSTGEKIVVGGGGGVVTLWERGQWDDQDERIVVDKGYSGGGESLDILKLLPDGVGPGGKIVAAGLGDGRVRFIKLGPNKVVGQLRHDDVEGVVGLGFDVEGRLITGGGTTIKVWHEKVDEDNGAYVEEGRAPNAKFSIYDDSDDAADGAQDGASSDDDRGPKRKKQKGNKGGHLNGAAGNFSFAGLD